MMLAHIMMKCVTYLLANVQPRIAHSGSILDYIGLMELKAQLRGTGMLIHQLKKIKDLSMHMKDLNLMLALFKV